LRYGKPLRHPKRLVAKGLGDSVQLLPGLFGGPCGDLPKQRRTGIEFDAEVLSGSVSLDQICLPRCEMINPATHRKLVLRQLLGLELATPPVVAQRHHCLSFPLGIIGGPMEQQAVHAVMTIGKRIGLNYHLIAQHSLGGKLAGVDRR
jgi:hypothetical protein